MAIKFMTDTVKVGKVKSFADLVNEKMSKRASAQEKTVKTAATEDDDEAEVDDAEETVEEKDTEEVEASIKETVKTAEDKEDKEEDAKADGAGDRGACGGTREFDGKGPRSSAEKSEKSEKSEKTSAKTESSTDEADSSGQLAGEPNHQKGESVKPSAVTGENKKTEASSPTFVKVAKLDAKTRTMLKSYWNNLYPAEYVDAMLTDQ